MSGHLWIGASINFTVPGRLLGLRIYLNDNDNACHLVGIESTGGDLHKYFYMREVFRLPAVHGPGWVNTWLTPQLRITVGQSYNIYASYEGFSYLRTANLLSTPQTRNGITFTKGFTQTVAMPMTIAKTMTNYANSLDVLFQADAD